MTLLFSAAAHAVVTALCQQAEEEAECAESITCAINSSYDTIKTKTRFRSVSQIIVFCQFQASVEYLKVSWSVSSSPGTTPIKSQAASAPTILTNLETRCIPPIGPFAFPSWPISMSFKTPGQCPTARCLRRCQCLAFVRQDSSTPPPPRQSVQTH